MLIRYDNLLYRFLSTLRNEGITIFFIFMKDILCFPIVYKIKLFKKTIILNIPVWINGICDSHILMLVCVNKESKEPLSFNPK